MKTHSRTIPFPAWCSRESHVRVRATLEISRVSLIRIHYSNAWCWLSSFVLVSVFHLLSAGFEKSIGWDVLKHWGGTPRSRTTVMHAGHVSCPFTGMDLFYHADIIRATLCISVWPFKNLRMDRQKHVFGCWYTWWTCKIFFLAKTNSSQHVPHPSKYSEMKIAVWNSLKQVCLQRKILLCLFILIQTSIRNSAYLFRLRSSVIWGVKSLDTAKDLH